MVHPTVKGGGRDLSPFLDFLNSTRYVTVWTMAFVMSGGENGIASLKAFLAEQRRPILITMSDLQLPRPFGQSFSSRAITVEALNSTVGHWFATNPEVNGMIHPRVHDFPIGNRFGTSIESFRERLDDSRRRSAAAAAAATATAAISGSAAAIDEDQRPNLLMCCCMANHGSNTGRVANRQRLVDNGFPCLATGKKLLASENDFYGNMTKAKFVFSPRGRGWVNWRDMESIYLGAIPLVDARVQDPKWYPDIFPQHMWNGTMYEELPVVRVTNWSRVTPNYLEKVWASFTKHRQRVLEEDKQLLLQQEQQQPFTSSSRRTKQRRKLPSLDTGEQGTLLGTNLRRAWTPYHLGRVIAALGHCKRREVTDNAEELDSASSASPWWCDPGWHNVKIPSVTQNCKRRRCKSPSCPSCVD